jgi:hypothetical protein
MVVFGSVRDLVFLGLLSLSALAACKDEMKTPAAEKTVAQKPVLEEPMREKPVRENPVLAAQGNALEAANVNAPEDPEPEVHPCKHCSVDINKRVTGTWQESQCLPGSTGVAYPVGAPSIEVTSGAQKGMSFVVTTDAETFAVGDAMYGTLPENAEVNGWVEAKLWIKGASGTRCSSLLSIRR